jgi:fluoroacetyl-CoA thioesterase
LKHVPPGTRHSFTVATQYRDTAEAFGNPGVPVVGTPALIGFLETAADRCLQPFYEGREGSVGTAIDIAHLAPAPGNSTIEASAEVISVEGRQVRFAVEARLGANPLMKGFHERRVVDLDRFLARLAAEAASP